MPETKLPAPFAPTLKRSDFEASKKSVARGESRIIKFERYKPRFLKHMFGVESWDELKAKMQGGPEPADRMPVEKVPVETAPAETAKKKRKVPRE